jgi:diguanylate cyclase (GGDEF)-like protein/PAS domain S-box-containing protein
VTAFDASAYALSPYALPTAATTLLMLAFGGRVLIRRVSRVSAAFFVLTFVAAVWFGAFTAMYMARSATIALQWARVAYLGVPFIPAAVYQFTVEMLRITRKRRFAVFLSWSLAFIFSGMAVGTNLLVYGVSRYWWGFYPRYAPVSSLPFLTFFFAYLVGSVLEFIRAHGSSQGVERVRVRLLIVGFGIAYFGCVDFLPKYGVSVYPFGYLAIGGFVAVIAHVVRHYDLMPITPSLAANEIINTIADVLFVCDRDGRIQFANQSAERLLAYDPSELTGVRLGDLIAGGDALDETLQRRSIRSVEHEFRTKMGELVELTLSISPVMHQGDAAGAIIIGRDLRERKRAEREVRRAVTVLQSTLDSTADAILVTSGEGRVLTYNQRYLDMWRIPKDMVEMGDHRAILRTLADQVVGPSEYVENTQKLYEVEEAESFDVLDFVDGRRFERYSIGRKIEGVAVVRVWSFRDVTARFKAEAALRESEGRYRLLFEQNAAGVCVSTEEGAIVDCNATYARMLGYTRAELVGRNITDLYERGVERAELLSMLRDSPTINGVEVELRRKDGGKVWVLQNLAHIDQNGSAFIHATLVDISDRKRAEEQIEFHAYHDVLTQLPNRRLFTDRLAQNITRSRRSGRPLAVFFIDLDRFKDVNDTLGHTAGDELLLEMSLRLRKCVREEDTVARLGGDEFTMILSDLRNPEDAIQVAEKILKKVSEPIVIAGTPIEASASIGIALYPTDGSDVDSLLRNADSAMYRAKESGRNNYQLCTAEMKRRAIERFTMEARLRKAIPNGELMLLYQPQVSLVSGRVVGAEALVRWNDPERGMIEPMAFIPTAEESRLIIPLGEWVLRAACTQARQWHDRGLKPLRVAVNLSAKQFQQHDLVDMIRRILIETKVDASSIELEITETTAMQNADATVDVLRSLCNLGLSISIDDFGTGYSSLAYLKRFPLASVKIDRSFVAGIAANEGDAAIVGAVIAIARAMRLRVIAEGVETEEQFALLQRRQCDEAQGFYFGAPMSADSLTKALIERRALGIREPRLFL